MVVPSGPQDFDRLEVIGQGHAGRVYLARLKGTDRMFAMKTLKKDVVHEKREIMLPRVLNELKILKAVDHPFVMSLYWAFQDKEKTGRLYYLLEYCPGGEFYRFLQKQKNCYLKEEPARFYACEIMLALEYLHMKGIVYRDLKPENILIDSTGHLRLTDFDLASPRAADEKAWSAVPLLKDKRRGMVDVRPKCRMTSFVGTPEYLAPELFAKKPHYGCDVDWWTFGCFMFEMVCGKLAFDGDSHEAIFKKIQHDKITYPPNIKLNSHTTHLISKLLEKKPEQRLGHAHGAAEIKLHPFFRKVNFDLIRNQRPPFVPPRRNPTDTSAFQTSAPDDMEDIADMCYEDDDRKAPVLGYNVTGFDNYKAKNKDVYGLLPQNQLPAGFATNYFEDEGTCDACFPRKPKAKNGYQQLNADSSRKLSRENVKL